MRYLSRVSLLLAFVALSSQLHAKAASKEEAQSALFDFWQSFEKQQKDGHSNKDQYLEQLRVAKEKEAAEAEAKAMSEQVDALNRAIEYQRSVLTSAAGKREHDVASLSMAQALYQLAGRYPASDAKTRKPLLDEANQICQNLQKQGVESDLKHQLMYLSALLEGQTSKSRKAMSALAAESGNSLYIAYANITLGDEAFAKEQSNEAARYYDKALNIFTALRLPSDRTDVAQLSYRLAWTAYRNAELEKAIKYAQTLVQPGVRLNSEESLLAVRKDAVELIGSSLFENNDYDLTLSTLRKKIHASYASQVGTVILARYYDAQLYEQQLSFARFLQDQFPLASDLPAWLVINAQAANKLGQTSKEYEYYYQLATLLPKQSLWRSKNQNATNMLTVLDTTGLPLVQKAADYFYDQGSKSASTPYFTQASAAYRAMIDYDPDHKLSNSWRAREAHCYYFAENYEHAKSNYKGLIEDKKLDKSTHEIVAYQLVMSAERQWRQSFNKMLESKKTPEKSPEVVGLQKDLEDSVNDFANRFPNSNRSSELLLVMASVLRDTDQVPKAKKYWERVLVAQPSSAQRALALRGLILASLDEGDSEKLANLAERFLKLEDWKQLGAPLKAELEGVLSRAVTDASAQRNKLGKSLDAGLILARTAEQFPSVPEREKMYRDGAYLIALGGDWTTADELAQRYFDQGLKRFEADMLYLRARSLEYQFRFDKAAQTYLSYAERFPKDKKLSLAYERAFALASADESSSLSARAAEGMSKLQKDPDQKAFYLEAAHSGYLADKQWKKALAVAASLKALGGSSDRNLKAELLSAKTHLASGDKEKGIKQLENLAIALRRERGRMKPSNYRDISGEAHILLGKEYTEAFDDYKLAERSGPATERIRIKSARYDSLSKAYEFAASSAQPKWAAQARYELAEVAARFSDELGAFIAEERSELGGRYAGYKDIADRLRANAKRFHTENVLARSKAPQQYRGNEWVRLSALRVSASPQGRDETMSAGLDMTESYDMPSTWSL